jgi:hypothetical protein
MKWSFDAPPGSGDGESFGVVGHRTPFGDFAVVLCVAVAAMVGGGMVLL